MKKITHAAAVIACLLTALAAAARSARAEAPLAVPADEKPFAAELAAVDADWQLTFRAGGQSRAMPAAELVRWGACREPARGPIVVLADGGLLVAEVLRADKETLTADSELFSVLKLPLESLCGVVFHPPAGRNDRDLLLDRVVQAAGESDRLVLDNGDELSGLVEAITGDAVNFRAEVGQLKIETQRIAAMIFNPALKQAIKRQPSQAWVGLADGSRLVAAQLLLDDSSLKITTAAGQTWKTAPQKLVFLQPLFGHATYLSDLKPESYRQVPFLDLPWPYHNDRNVSGGMLRCGGRLYLKGLGVHSAARLTYLLDQPYRRFEAELGIDDSTAGGGSVRFRVFVDDREKFTSETIRGGQPPVPISVDLSGGKRLELVVDYAEGADVLDHANWLDARLVKGEGIRD
jgi:hypothetical protein